LLQIDDHDDLETVFVSVERTFLVELVLIHSQIKLTTKV